MKIENESMLKQLQANGLKKIFPAKTRITVGMGTCGTGNGADKVFAKLQEGIAAKKLDIELTPVGCFGFCAQEPLVSIYYPGKPMILLSAVTVEDVDGILAAAAAKEVPQQKVMGKVENWDFWTTDTVQLGKDYASIPQWSEIPYFKWQKKIVLRDCGLINPDDITEYFGVGGYSALYKALHQLGPDGTVDVVKKSKLRGRGGAGFPTGRKWELMKNVPSDKKYIICNADEGDPGAYMNRNEIESDPHMLIEGMMIGAFAMGANEGICYVRAEYPLAVERLKRAIEQARQYGIIGQKIMGSNFNFEMNVVEGAGAFVCGEETALIASIENKAGRPRPRPPFPAQKGLWGKPTNINNVETWCNVPAIIAKGGDWFAATGTQASAGTKVFSLVGKVKNSGLVELPLGSPLEVIVFNIGGGSCTEKPVKSAQLGGPSGGCVPVHLFNTPVDYESLAAIGAIMGSGGMVVMDEFNCMVDVARYFTEFTTSESCGKCVPCREGLNQCLNILNKICTGKAVEEDLATLEMLGKVIRDSSLCGLGQTAPNPVLTTMQYFKDEYLAHIREHRCAAGVCKDLYLAPCENSCPLHANVPGFLELIKEGRDEEAFQLFMESNPLPSVSGRVCQAHCNVICRRHDVDGAVNQKEVHRYLADLVYHAKKEENVLQRFIDNKLPPTGKKVAIVGAGPAGLTAAFYLVRLGNEVVIYDALPKPGGMLRYAIPEYRLPKTIIEKEIDFIERLGVKFVNNTRIGVDIQLEDLERDFDAIFLAIGVWKEMPMDVPGVNLTGVLPSFKVLEDVAANKNPNLGKKVVVIGGGNSAIDSARSALRLGKEVTIVYRRERADMPAFEEEIHAAEAERIHFAYMTAPKEIIGQDGKVTGLKVERMTYGDYDRTGRRRPVGTGEVYTIPCDNVIIAIGEQVDSEFIQKYGIETHKGGRVRAEPFSLQTNKKKFFAGGDLVSGPSTVAEAMASGKRAAVAIDLFLTGESNFGKLFTQFKYENRVPEKPEAGERNEPKEIPVDVRCANFKEVNIGLSEAQLRKEVCRCMRCDVREVQ
jgi:NADH-quinone oxidoreductase subunit F